MAIRKGEKKKFRKRVADVGERRKVGPPGDDEVEDAADRKRAAELEVESMSDVSSHDVEVPQGTMDAAEGGNDSGNVFKSAVSHVLNEGDGFLGSYSLKEQKREEKAKRRLEKKRLKRKRAFEVEGGQGYISESSESEASEDEAARRKRDNEKKAVKRHMLSQAHNRHVPSMMQPDYEKRLRRVATKGLVRLFNAVAIAQQTKPHESPSTKPSQQHVPEVGEQAPKANADEKTKEEVTRSKFLDMLRKGSESKKILKEDAEREAEAAKPPPKKKPRRK